MKKLNILIGGVLILAGMTAACKKDSKTVPPVNNGDDNGSTVIIAPTEPAIASTQGFFLDNWEAKTWSISNTKAVGKSSAGNITVSVDLSQQITKVSKYIYGNNLNPFMGQMVTEPDLMANITNLSPNVIRFPGGSLSDVYFWDDNKAPADAPAQLSDNTGTYTDAGYWFGNNTASWTLTLDNYYAMLHQTNSTGLITVNYGYARYGTGPHPDEAAAHLAAQWVRYDKGRTKLWEVGNENYGNWEAGYRINRQLNQDGQPEILTGQVYGTHFKVFADSMRKAAAEVGSTIKIGIVLTETNDQNAGVRNWNAGVLSAAGNTPDFFVVHNYYTPYQQNSTPDVILATPTTVTSDMMNWVKTSAQNAGVTQKPVALDEWNIFATGSKQMVSNVAGVHAVMVLGEVLKNQFSMASRWDMANWWDNGDDHGLFSNSGNPGGAEPGAPKWSLRPAFYYLYYFQKFIGDHLVSSSTAGSTDVVSYGSSFTSGEAGVILVNKGSNDHLVNVSFKNFAAGNNYYYYTLNGGTDNAPFSRKLYVNGIGPSGDMGGPATYTSIPANSSAIKGGIVVTVPARGVVFLVANKK
ncbi:alpha-L-arabinofuranosidase [Mucilaginibacter pineti]|nr:alpha-L-arabinofuranosidase [Mucilaginibacter pineti]